MAIKTRKTKTSKGSRRSVATKMKQTESQKLMNKLEAKARGQKVYITVANPNKSETNKLFVKVLL